ncbi:hypothetical protein M422DRAFT_259768 [Sphaerobolus stellatus SS14]|uniref:Uncharacterized protein n=1 Tax=Sphaerobolus stellatus (strain SS14) TaxID=990650 RepID=A0A0C9VJQ7_SPHS4|nr:hypothetical protein M422DRAFT_259768 [Sphaerobolus stellatus SS14]
MPATTTPPPPPCSIIVVEAACPSIEHISLTQSERERGCVSDASREVLRYVESWGIILYLFIIEFPPHVPVPHMPHSPVHDDPSDLPILRILQGDPFI